MQKLNDFPTPAEFFHGSYDELEVGQVLTCRPWLYTEAWGQTPFYQPLHRWKPVGLLRHADSVFMCADDEDIDLAGGAIDFVYVVEPIGPVQRHDLNWSSEISALLDVTDDIEDPRFQRAAEAYWAGEPHPDESVWEYLTTEFRIVRKLDEVLVPGFP